MKSVTTGACIFGATCLLARLRESAEKVALLRDYHSPLILLDQNKAVFERALEHSIFRMPMIRVRLSMTARLCLRTPRCNRRSRISPDQRLLCRLCSGPTQAAMISNLMRAVSRGEAYAIHEPARTRGKILSNLCPVLSMRDENRIIAALCHDRALCICAYSCSSRRW